MEAKEHDPAMADQLSHADAQQLHHGIGHALQWAQDHPSAALPPAVLFDLTRARELAALVVFDTDPDNAPKPAPLNPMDPTTIAVQPVPAPTGRAAAEAAWTRLARLHGVTVNRSGYELADRFGLVAIVIADGLLVTLTYTDGTVRASYLDEGDFL
jgi:hypothetical protein